jgi:hypothetical protein
MNTATHILIMVPHSPIFSLTFSLYEVPAPGSHAEAYVVGF